jgi:hypothetical protein
MNEANNDNQDAPLKEDNADKTVDSADIPKIDDQESTAAKVEESIPGFNAQTSYESLQSELAKQTKAYNEIRKEFTRRTQHESELQKKLDQVYDTLAKATETPIDPEQFIRDLRTQGPKAFEPHFSKWVEPMKAEHNKQIEERDARALKLETNFELLRRRTDAESYPDFKQLEPIMAEIAESDNCPVNWNLGVSECYDLLYKLAKDRSAEKAVKIAHQAGKQEAEKELVKEAKTAVTGGGKTAGTTVPNLDNEKDISKLRELVIQLHGVADRD